jgi:hypothetical protein
LTGVGGGLHTEAVMALHSCFVTAPVAFFGAGVMLHALIHMEHSTRAA